MSAAKIQQQAKFFAIIFQKIAKIPSRSEPYSHWERAATSLHFIGKQTSAALVILETFKY